MGFDKKSNCQRVGIQLLSLGHAGTALDFQQNVVSMNSDALGLFAHVAATCNFTHSARALGMSRPALSMRIRSLEKELGVSLFERIGRGIRLTQAGQRLLVHANDMDRILQDARMAMRNHALGQLSVLKVSTGRTSGDLDAPLWISQFQKSHPAVYIKTHICNTTETVDRILSGQAELGVVGNPPEHPLIHQEFVQDEVLDLVCSPKLCKITSSGKTKTQSHIERMLVREKSSGTRSVVEKWISEQEIHPTQWIELCSDQAIKHAALLGVGFAMLPARLIRKELQDRSLISWRIGNAPVRMRSCILYSKKQKLSAISRAFADLVAKYYENLAG